MKYHKSSLKFAKNLALKLGQQINVILLQLGEENALCPLARNLSDIQIAIGNSGILTGKAEEGPKNE